MAVKGQRNHDKGPPHLHVGTSALQAICSLQWDGASEYQMAILKALPAWTQQILQETAEATFPNIRYAQVADTYDKSGPKLSKAILAVEGLPAVSRTSFLTVNEAVGKILGAGQPAFKGGPAPPGPEVGQAADVKPVEEVMMTIRVDEGSGGLFGFRP